MSKKHKKTEKIKDKSHKSVQNTQISKWLNPKWHLVAIFGLAFILYANTLTHQYTQDDAIVIYDNMFTQKGFAGIPGILQYDTFYGFFKEAGKEKLVSGGRYRPMTLIMFAIEYQIFGKSPLVGHLINIILYGLLGIMLYKLLEIMLLPKNENKALRGMVFFTCLLYIAHPIHTEAVANIKGRDEIMTFLGAVVALWCLFKYSYNTSTKWLITCTIAFFVALMSKENAITFLAIVPLSFLFFRKYSLVQSIKISWPFILSAVVFLVIRFSVLGMDFGGSPRELMNNPFLKIVNNQYIDFTLGERLATIIYTLGKYVQLMVFPHPLSHDYYPRAIDIMSFGDWQVLLSLVLYLGMIALAFLTWKKDKIISYAILFYLITLSIVSNIVFPIGTNMSERFIFMSSFGFILLLAYLLYNYIGNEKIRFALIGFLLLAYSAKTITRNTVWKDDFTLFTTDVKKNSNSAKLLNAAGGTLTTEASKMKDSPQKTQYLNDAIQYLEKAVKIHPTYRNAYLLLGNAHYYLKNFEQSINYFDHCIKLDPGFNDAIKNLPIVLRDGGRHMGQIENNFVLAEKWLQRSYSMNQQDYETCRLLGITYGIQGKHANAVMYFEKAIALRPDIAANYVSLGTAYNNMGDKEKAREALDKALEIDPQALNKLVN